LEGKDQKDCSLRPAWADNLQDLTTKILNTKKDWKSGSSGRTPASKYKALNSNPSAVKKNLWVWWCMPEISVMLMVKVGESPLSKAISRQNPQKPT
jgi:hypothetical protein